MAAALLAAVAVLRAQLLLAVVAELRVLRPLLPAVVVPRVLRAHKPRVPLALLAVVAELRVVLLEVVVELLLLSRPSFSVAMARITPCPAPAPTYERVPRSR